MMIMTPLYLFFLNLVRLGLGAETCRDDRKQVVPVTTAEAVDWRALYAMATQQGLSAVALDGLELLTGAGGVSGDASAGGTTAGTFKAMDDGIKRRWIGDVMLGEARSAKQWSSAANLAELLGRNGIRTYVLKGAVVSECYPVPSHRVSVDLDCFLLPMAGDDNVWERGNSIVEEAGFKVARDFYKNSTFTLPGLTVENHQFLTPFRGNRCLKQLERVLQALIREDAGSDRMDGTCLLRPPAMASALFLLEHAYSHFLHEGLTWRHVLDWMMFSRRHAETIDWPLLNRWIDEFGFRRFYESFSRLGRMLLGELEEEDLSALDRMMLSDVWARLDLHESVRGFKGKLALAGNTWRARWKYRHFSELSWFQALWIQAIGVLFIRRPRL